jgi:CheY-like chemotaxis protein
LVEDEEAVRDIAAHMLRVQGYTVLEAANGQAGLRVAKEQVDPPIDLVITDVIMPQMGGKVMADWLREERPKLKVLFTSGYTDDAFGEQGVLGSGTAFLAKPYSRESLASKVRELLDKSD